MQCMRPRHDAYAMRDPTQCIDKTSLLCRASTKPWCMRGCDASCGAGPPPVLLQATLRDVYFRRSGCKMLFCLDNSELRSTPRCRSIPSEHHLHTQALPWAVTTVKQQQKRKGCQQQLNKELRTVAATNDDGDSKASPNAGSDFETKMLPHKATDPESSK